MLLRKVWAVRKEVTGYQRLFAAPQPLGQVPLAVFKIQTRPSDRVPTPNPKHRAPNAKPQPVQAKLPGDNAGRDAVRICASTCRVQQQEHAACAVAQWWQQRSHKQQQQRMRKQASTAAQRPKRRNQQQYAVRQLLFWKIKAAAAAALQGWADDTCGWCSVCA